MHFNLVLDWIDSLNYKTDSYQKYEPVFFDLGNVVLLNKKKHEKLSGVLCNF